MSCDHVHPKNDALTSRELAESLVIDTEEKVFGMHCLWYIGSLRQGSNSIYHAIQFSLDSGV